MQGLLGSLSQLACGLALTVQLLALSSLFGVVLAVPLAVARLSRLRPLAWFSAGYSGFFRGTPLLVQIYLIYYGLAQFGFIRHSVLWVVLRNAWPCALIAFSLNMAAYVSEVVRGGILAVPQGEIEAAKALGLHPWLRYRLVILPRAFRLILPALGNEVIVQMKSTSLASTITLLDLTGVARRLAAASYSTDPLIIAGLIYAALAWLLGRGFRMAEKRFNRHRRA
ncbi:MAG TPA: ABC transporter permease subunit [Acetobacteraceae bacterium]|nr:ABC transporter permease subunit [Acetobacteraceae bacterium]